MATASLHTGITRQDPATRAAQAPSGVPVFLGYGRVRPEGGAGPAFSAPYLVTRWAGFAAAFDPARAAEAGPSTTDAFLVAAVRGFFDSGGDRCWVVLLEKPAAAAAVASAWQDALAALAGAEGFDLVCTPSLGQHDDATVLEVQASVLRFCCPEPGGFPACFAILDGVGGADADGGLELARLHTSALLGSLGSGGAAFLRAAAIYFPWVRPEGLIDDDAGVRFEWTSLPGDAPRFLPACGHVAGVYAATDRKAGPYKAPANVSVERVVDLALGLTDAEQDSLQGVNCLRAFPGRGIRVWGARTPLASLVDAANPITRADFPWLFVNVQRLFMAEAAWLERALAWATFEPNDLSLWNRVIRQVSGHLGQLYARGALAGASPAEAFFVKCDAENNPAEQRALGQLVVEIGLAPTVPGEFIVLRLTQTEDGRTSTEGT